MSLAIVTLFIPVQTGMNTRNCVMRHIVRHEIAIAQCYEYPRWLETTVTGRSLECIRSKRLFEAFAFVFLKFLSRHSFYYQSSDRESFTSSHIPTALDQNFIFRTQHSLTLQALFIIIIIISSSIRIVHNTNTQIH